MKMWEWMRRKEEEWSVLLGVWDRQEVRDGDLWRMGRVTVREGGGRERDGE